MPDPKPKKLKKQFSKDPDDVKASLKEITQVIKQGT